MPKTAVALPGPVGPLEAVLSEPESRPTALAVICHPHPLHQGTMNNKVAVTLARGFESLGAATLRFNFRGVGQSAGEHAHGVGERDDAAAAAAWLRARWPGAPLHLAGFSFGAMIGISLAAELEAASLITVAPAVQRLQGVPALPRCPWLLVQGGRDELVDPALVRRWIESLEFQPRLALLDDADHFFHGRLQVLASSVQEFLLAFDEFAPARQTHA
jgi:alpha/beta superfamily hydrolase